MFTEAKEQFTNCRKFKTENERLVNSLKKSQLKNQKNRFTELKIFIIILFID